MPFSPSPSTPLHGPRHPGPFLASNPLTNAPRAPVTVSLAPPRHRRRRSDNFESRRAASPRPEAQSSRVFVGYSVYKGKAALTVEPRAPEFAPLGRRQTSQSRRRGQVFAYYGLTTPPYRLDSLEPYMSKRTLELHWGKLHQDYVDCLNKQLANSPLYGYTMEELIKVTYNNGNPLPEYNNAAQVWNHDFFWESMQPDGGNLPSGGVLQQIEKDFGSFSNFRDEFVQSAITLFGSGWVWLILKSNEKRLMVVKTSNAICPMVWGDIPIICLDVWEHAYYLDYKDDRRNYANNFMDHLVSWHSVTSRMMRAEAFVNLGEPKIPVA